MNPVPDEPETAPEPDHAAGPRPWLGHWLVLANLLLLGGSAAWWVLAVAALLGYRRVDPSLAQGLGIGLQALAGVHSLTAFAVLKQEWVGIWLRLCTVAAILLAGASGQLAIQSAQAH